MYYVKESNLIQVECAEEDGLLMGIHPYKTGDIIATDEAGFQYVINDEYFYKNYVSVRKLKRTTKPTKSPFELEYAEQLANFSLESNVESDEYILGTSRINNKAI